MAEDRAPRLCDEVGRHPIYSTLPMQQRVGARAYLGVPLELSDGTRVGSLAALSRTRSTPFTDADEQLFVMLARVLASELERESNERDLRRFNDMLRDQATGWARSAAWPRRWPARDDARTGDLRGGLRGRWTRRSPSCSSRPGATSSRPRWPAWTIAPVTIQPRGETPSGPGRAFTSKETYFVADARNHPALAAPLVEATAARSAVFEPVLRDGQVGRRADRDLAEAARGAAEDAPAGVLRLLAAQAAIAIEHAGAAQRGWARWR